MKSNHRFLLDTDISSYIIRGIPSVLTKAALFSEQYAISSVTKFELSRARSELKLAKSKGLLDIFLQEVPILEFDSAAAGVAADVYQTLERQGNRIGVPDSMIAGHALCIGLPLVTNNHRRFARIQQLQLINWLE